MNEEKEKQLTLYPELSEKGNNEAIELLKKFQETIRVKADEVFRDLYCEHTHFIETDSWTNYRTTILDGLKNYSWAKNQLSYDYKRIRRAMFEEYRDEIINDLNQDLLETIKEKDREILILKEHIKMLNRY